MYGENWNFNLKDVKGCIIFWSYLRAYVSGKPEDMRDGAGDPAS